MGTFVKKINLIIIPSSLHLGKNKTVVLSYGLYSYPIWMFLLNFIFLSLQKSSNLFVSKFLKNLSKKIINKDIVIFFTFFYHLNNKNDIIYK